VAYVISLFVNNSNKKGQPPRMPSYLPFIGNIVGFGQNPVTFIQSGAKKVCEEYQFIYHGSMEIYSQPKF
jgi:hypothetical protein